MPDNGSEAIHCSTDEMLCLFQHLPNRDEILRLRLAHANTLANQLPIFGELSRRSGISVARIRFLSDWLIDAIQTEPVIPFVLDVSKRLRRFEMTPDSQGESQHVCDPYLLERFERLKGHRHKEAMNRGQFRWFTPPEETRGGGGGGSVAGRDHECPSGCI